MASSTKQLPKPRYIMDLTPEEKVKFLDSFDLVFSDIDGVLWNIVTGVNIGVEGFKALSKNGKKYNFITNNSIRSEESFEKNFKVHGLDVDYSEIIHPAMSIVKYLNGIHFDGLIYCIGTENFKNVIRKGGFKIIDGPTKILEEGFADLSKYVFDKQPVRAVVVDFDFNLSGPKLIRAHQYLQHPDCILISGATDMTVTVFKDIQMLGPGPFVNILAEASGKTAVVLAKPGKELADLLEKHYEIKDKSRILMVGDTLKQDIGFGKVAGLKTLLVLSGECSKEDMINNSNPDYQPDYYADSMGDFVKLFENSKL